MHEMSLAEGVLQIIEDAARSEGFTQVKAVWLEIGQLAGVEKESLCFYFDVVTRNSIAQDARLEIIEMPGRGKCLQCACDMLVATLFEACTQCGSYQIEVISGDELRVKELEVE